ncbi:MAG: ABC transporter substrate-binding protein [Trueperaceae bacterium]|nr:MAG: ABC transporter substrate-binding protein [Trueperaceae bacterium]
MLNRIGLFISCLSLLSSLACAQVELTVFIGGQQRPGVIRSLLETFNDQNPDINVTFEVGGATTDVQYQFLSAVLSQKSGDIDVFLLDVVLPASFVAAGWLEPLDSLFDDEEAMQTTLATYLPAAIEPALVDGSLYALPAFSDVQFLYYRSDLLDAYGFDPPVTWSELKAQALEILEGERQPGLEGFNYQGAAIEGTNCTFLEALWSAGGDWRDPSGAITLDSPEGQQALAWYGDTLASGITKEDIFRTSTDHSRQVFQAGRAVFMLNWSYAWAHLQGNSPQPTLVAGKVGLAPLPAFEGRQSASCIGGFLWGISAFSRHKEEAFRLIRFLASEETGRALAIEGGTLPAQRDLYADPLIIEAAPHVAELLGVVENARSRPVTPFYVEVSEIIKTNMNAFLAGRLTADEALGQMQLGLEKLLGRW